MIEWGLGGRKWVIHSGFWRKAWNQSCGQEWEGYLGGVWTDSWVIYRGGRVGFALRKLCRFGCSCRQICANRRLWVEGKQKIHSVSVDLWVYLSFFSKGGATTLGTTWYILVKVWGPEESSWAINTIFSVVANSCFVVILLAFPLTSFLSFVCISKKYVPRESSGPCKKRE